MTALSHYSWGSVGTAGDGYRSRRPRCLRHHVWLASCPDCVEAHRPEPKEAK